MLHPSFSMNNIAIWSNTIGGKLFREFDDCVVIILSVGLACKDYN